MKLSFKKSICGILIGLLLFNFTVLSYATDNTGLENAIIVAKRKIEIPFEYSEFYSNIEVVDKITNYELNWNDEENNSITVSINNKNDITRYYKSDSFEMSKPKFAKFTYQELAKTAEDWIKALNSSWSNEIILAKTYNQNNIHSFRTNIRFERKVNGVKFLDDYISVSLNNQTGDIFSMSSRWTYDNEYPGLANILSEEEALEKYFSVNPLELRYYTIDEGYAIPIYDTFDEYVFIDAHTGDEIDEEPFYNYSLTEEAAMDTAMMKSAGGANSKVRLTENELANLDEINNLLSEDKLKELAVSLENTGLDKATYKDCRYERSYNNEKAYEALLTFIFNEKKDNEYYANVRFDAKTGELLIYNAYNYHEEEGTADAEKARNGALSFIKKYAEKYALKTKLSTRNYDNKYLFNFVRYENGIPYYSNHLTVEVDKMTGSICGYYKMWDEPVFEDVSGVLTMEEAKKAYLESIGLKLEYEYAYSNDENKPKIKLCYTTENENPLNAKTADVLNPKENIEGVYPIDIAGHYAEMQIKKLVDEGVIEYMDLFEPEKKITYEEYAKMVSELMFGYWPIEVKEAKVFLADNNILLNNEEYVPENNVKRIDGPVYLLRALGYGEVAELPDIYKSSFSDYENISAEKIGYACIAKAMGILNGDENGRLNPEEELSRADAAIIIYNYLAR